MNRVYSSEVGPVLFPISARLSHASPAKVLLLGQHLRLEALQSRGQGRTPIPNLLRTDQPKTRVTVVSSTVTYFSTCGLLDRVTTRLAASSRARPEGLKHLKHPATSPAIRRSAAR